MDLLNSDIIWGVSPVTAVATLLIIILGVMYYFDVGVPPGPRGVPYFGYWPFLSNEGAHLELYDLTKKYGDVYSLKVMGHLIIHLGSMKAVKEAHLMKGDCFTQRYAGFNTITSIFKGGLVCLNGDPWKVQRKFFIQVFKEFGFTSSKKYMDGPIYDALMTTMKTLRAEDGKSVNIIPILSLHCSAVVRRMMFNDDGITDEEMKQIIEEYGKTFSVFVGTRPLLNGEFSRRFIFPFMADYRVAMKGHKIVFKILHDIVKRHEETFKEDNIRDVIDAYFKERNDRRQKNDPTAEYFTANSLVPSLIQIVGDSTVGVAVFISLFLHALLKYPEEQEKLFQELEEVLGPDRQPTTDDKSNLTYMNAFMYEVLRFSDFITMFPGLECTKKTTLNGYNVPEGAITLVNFWACHRDPKVFEDPNVFRPARYIADPEGQRAELPITFGVGKRACAGEYFTMMQVFLFLSTVVKNFRLEQPGGSNKNPITDIIMEITAIPRRNDISE